MASFSRSAANALGAGYDLASPEKDKNQKTAYQRYIEKFYGPDVTSHKDPLALARAATGAVAEGLKSGAGFLGHAAAGLLGMPRGDSGASRTASTAVNTGGGIGSDVGAVSGLTPSNRLYEGNPGTGAGVSAYNPGSTRQGMDGVLDAISQAEGTVKEGYNTVLGNGAYGRPSKPITDMTLQEVHDFGRNTLFAGQRAAGKTGPLSSATGRYQITGDNIKTYATRWGLDMKTTKWTPQLQDRIATDLAKNTPKGLANWEGFKYRNGPTLKKQAIAGLQGQPVSALAYTSTDQAQTPAQQAAAAQAAGTSGNITNRGENIAAMQRDLNSRGAKLTVDGLEGPLTRQAEQQFYGSPTSVRTPSFTNRPTYTSGQQDQGAVPRPGVPTYTSRANTVIPYSGRQDAGVIPTVGLRTPQTPYYNNPYTSSTGGSIDPNRRTVQAVPVQGDVAHKSPLPGYYNDQTASGMTIQGGRPVPTRGGYAPTMAPVLTGGFSRAPVPQTPYINQPYSMSPYTGTTGGANAIVQPAQTARIPQARPNYQPPQQAVPTAGTGLSLEALQAMAEKYGVPVTRVAQVARDVGGQMRDAMSQGMSRNAGNNYSGGNYSGGSYGGAGGRSISSGVGGAFKNR